MGAVLITGATGFIGGHLVDANLEKGRQVRAFHLPGDPGVDELKSKGVETIAGDIRDADAVEKAARGVDVIFHCAAVVTDWAPKSLFEGVTVQGTENVCKAALSAGVSRLVDLSTNDVFGLGEDRVMDESHPLTPWGEPYSDYKIAAEKISRKYHHMDGLPVTWAYPCWVYGLRDMTFVPLLAEAIVNKDMLFWRKDVMVWPTYIENLVDLLMLLATDERAVGQGFLVHDGESDTLQEFSAKIAAALNVPAPTFHIPYWAAYVAAVGMEGVWRLLKKTDRPLLTTYAVKNLGSRLKFSIQKAEDVLGWKPEVSYEQGFAKTMEWLKTVDLEALKGK